MSIESGQQRSLDSERRRGFGNICHYGPHTIRQCLLMDQSSRTPLAALGMSESARTRQVIRLVASQISHDQFKVTTLHAKHLVCGTLTEADSGLPITLS